MYTPEIQHSTNQHFLVVLALYCHIPNFPVLCPLRDSSINKPFQLFTIFLRKWCSCQHKCNFSFCIGSILLFSENYRNFVSTHQLLKLHLKIQEKFFVWVWVFLLLFTSVCLKTIVPLIF